MLERTELPLALSTTHDESRRERQWLRQVIEGATDGAILLLAQGQKGWRGLSCMG